MAPGPHPDDDEAMRAYLRRLDLAQLELDEVQLEHEPDAESATDPVAWAQLLLLVLTLAGLAYFPTTVAYQRHGLGAWWLGCGGLVAAALALGLRRWLWARARQLRGRPGAAADAAAGAAGAVADALGRLRLAPRTLRWVMLGGALSLMALLVFALPHDADWQGRGYSAAWFYAVLAAIVAGILLGRWLMLQAAVDTDPDAPPRPPIVLPPWLKWVTLTGMGLGGVVVINGEALFGAESEAVGFGLGGAGFALGIGMAIWLARRFDEMEQRAEQEAAAARERALEEVIAAAAAAPGQDAAATGD